jgi:SAM-dependent methyltransferase
MAAVEVDHVAVEQRLLDDALRPGAAALEAGCGRTTRLRFYRDRIERLVGVDADEPAGRENPSVDEFVHANLDERLPFDDASFDVVYANFVVEHLDDPAGAFADWRRLLRPDGRVVDRDEQPGEPGDGTRRAAPEPGPPRDQAPWRRSGGEGRLPDPLPREHAEPRWRRQPRRAASSRSRSSSSARCTATRRVFRSFPRASGRWSGCCPRSAGRRSSPRTARERSNPVSDPGRQPGPVYAGRVL